MPVLTPARSGLARAGATRSGYPILAGVRVPLYALSGVARSGATRSNYTSPKVFVSIGGTQYATGRTAGIAAGRVLYASGLSITDTLNETPNTAEMRTKNFVPTVGQEVIITLGSRNNPHRLFAGRILRATQGYEGTPGNYFHDLSVIDYTWTLNKKKVTGYYTGSATTIAKSLITTYATDHTSVNVEAGLPTVDGGITFTNQDLTDALTQLAKRIGADWYDDYTKDIHFYLTLDGSVTRPTALNTVNPVLLSFAATRDISQWLTRVLVEGGGSNALEAVAVGETIIPLVHVGWYQTLGGTVVSGPQRITYTGIVTGGSGSLVGPGAAPSAAPVAALQSGSGIESGAHDYAVAFETASGVSLVGPRATITVGLVSAPATAATAGAPTIGTGPDPGTHLYALTFVNASGETTAGPTVSAATTLTTAPTATPTTARSAGTGIDYGTHEYAVSYLTSIGETTPSPVSAQATTSAGVAAIADPGAPIFNGVSSETSGLTVGGTYAWKYTYRRDSDGATTAGGTASASQGPWGASQAAFVTAVAAPSGYSIRWFRTTGSGATYLANTGMVLSSGTMYKDTTADASLGEAAPTTNNTAIPEYGQILVAAIAVPTDANVTSKNLYRRSGGAGLKLVINLANATTSYLDSMANASLGAASLGTSTAYVQRIPLSNLALGTSLVTSRKLYGTVAGGSQLKLVATLNTTDTTYTVATTDASLGADVPTTNTAAANRVDVSSIPIGPSGTTARYLYRTRIGETTLRLVVVVTGNATTTYADSWADASLTTVAPSSDTSGLTQPAGVVLAGATSIIVAGTGAFRSDGGWAVIGNGQQVIRYTGISSSSLTGVPASGVGAIVASIAYNSTITAAPSLTGIPATGTGSVQYAILRGDDVNIFVTVNDTAAQTAHAALLGGDGIVEDFVQDRRLSSTEATARGNAHLALRNQSDVSISYTTHDINTRAGQTISVNLGSPTNVVADFLIQQVTIDTFQPSINPIFTVQASSDRFSFEDLLRIYRGAN